MRGVDYGVDGNRLVGAGHEGAVEVFNNRVALHRTVVRVENLEEVVARWEREEGVTVDDTQAGYRVGGGAVGVNEVVVKGVRRRASGDDEADLSVLGVRTGFIYRAAVENEWCLNV